MKIDSNNKTTAPLFLVEGESYEQGCARITHFLENSALLKYDSVEFDPELSCSAADGRFWAMLDSGLQKNRRSVKGLIGELEESGYSQLAQLSEMKQGYESKILHTLVHLLDGFIGIDSSFYNLIEDSHLLSDGLRRKIEQTPDHYQLLQVNARNLWSFL